MTGVPDQQRIILLVEDDTNDALLCQKALHESGTLQTVIHLPDGEDAIKYLNGDPPYQDRTKYPLPALVLLDLKMPKLTGFDVLIWLQNHPALASEIPVIVLTGSIYPEDAKRAKQLGAVGYEIKPVRFTELVQIVRKASEPSQSNSKSSDR
jgi:CheY-like chemotaxis protein